MGYIAVLKIAEISQVDYQRGLVKVRIPDRDNIETNWLAMTADQYEMPRVNDIVRVNLDEHDYTNGLCHGRYYNQSNPPALSGPNIFYKRILGDMVMVYDSDTKTLTITAQTIKIVGDLEISGSLSVTGSITATGSITDTTGNTNHHTH